MLRQGWQLASCHRQADPPDTLQLPARSKGVYSALALHALLESYHGAMRSHGGCKPCLLGHALADPCCCVCLARRHEPCCRGCCGRPGRGSPSSARELAVTALGFHAVLPHDAPPHVIVVPTCLRWHGALHSICGGICPGNACKPRYPAPAGQLDCRSHAPIPTAGCAPARSARCSGEGGRHCMMLMYAAADDDDHKALLHCRRLLQLVLPEVCCDWCCRPRCCMVL